MAQDEVARLLREIRAQRGVSVREVARKVGVNPSYVSRVERGEKQASPAFRRRLAEHYEVPSDDLELAAGDVPTDIAAILRDHPELLRELRQRFAPG
jgi:HTH-type transcriptional regulator, competence development regulator